MKSSNPKMFILTTWTHQPIFVPTVLEMSPLESSAKCTNSVLARGVSACVGDKRKLGVGDAATATTASGGSNRGCGFISQKRVRTHRKNNAVAVDTSASAATAANPRTHTMKRVNKQRAATVKHAWDAFESILPDVDVASERDDVGNGDGVCDGGRTTCEKCSSSLRITDDGFLVCLNEKCSIVYKDVISHGAEWRHFAGDEGRGPDPTRCGMPSNPLLENSSYGCMLTANKNAMTKETWLMQRYVENQSATSKEKAMYKEYQDIIRMAQKFGVTQYIIDDALLYTKMISEHRLQTRGNNRLGMLAGTLYMSFCKNGCPRTCGEIASICGITPKHATRGCNHVQELINNINGKGTANGTCMDADVGGASNASTAVVDANPGGGDAAPASVSVGGAGNSGPECFVSRYCSNLDMAPKLIKLCLFVVELILARGLLSGNTPHSIAAGVVYYVIVQCGLNKTPDDVVRVSKLSKATFVKCYKQMDSCGKQFIPQTVLQQYRSV